MNDTNWNELEPLFLAVADVATMLGISRSTTLTLIQSGAIPSIRVGRQIRIPVRGLEQYLRLQGLDLKLIGRGSHQPTTARAAPVSSSPAQTQRQDVPGVTVR